LFGILINFSEEKVLSSETFPILQHTGIINPVISSQLTLQNVDGFINFVPEIN
jgi:hypothetical protein